MLVEKYIIQEKILHITIEIKVSDLSDDPGTKSIFDRHRLRFIIKEKSQSKNLITHKLNIEWKEYNGKNASEYIGYAIIDKSKKIYCLEYFEIFNKGKGYGKLLLKFLLEKYKEIYLYSINHSVNFYLKYGAKPLVCNDKDCLLVFANRNPSECHKDIFDKEMENKLYDNFIYIKSEWDNINNMF